MPAQFPALDILYTIFLDSHKILLRRYYEYSHFVAEALEKLMSFYKDI